MRLSILFAQQKQTDDSESNADDSLPGWRFAEKQDARYGHDRGATRQNGRNGRQRTASLKQQEERNCSCAYADAGEQRVIKTSSTEFLIPSSGKPEDGQVDQNRQCRAGFDNETAETFANAIGSKTCKDLVRAVKKSGNNRIPKPGCHEQKLTHEVDHSREN